MAEIPDADIPVIRDALLAMVSDTSAYDAIRDRYRDALRRLPAPVPVPEVRYVSSVDFSSSGDETAGQ